MQNITNIAPFTTIAALLYLSYFDTKNKAIPAIPTYVYTGVCLLAQLLFLLFDNGVGHQLAINSLVSSAIISAILTVIYILTKGHAFGIGDVFVIAIIALSGGLGKTLTSIAIASWTGTAYALYLGLKYHKFKGVHVPLIPFLTIGYIATLFLFKYFLAS